MKQEISVCFTEQAIKKNYKLEENPEGEVISPWTTFFIGIGVGALGTTYLLHH